ncbi:MAG: hypothetical protein KIS92_17755 [Planctomycetota bacterium]|nr:hypothetical protein [Planctomycetota bacterium]
MNRIATGLLAAGIVLAPAAVFFAPVFAQEGFLKATRKHYGLAKEKAGCALCHEVKDPADAKGHNLNAYGKDIQRQPDFLILMGKEGDYEFTAEEVEIFLACVKAVEKVDSDGDGATNAEELSLGTNPGDKAEAPEAEKLKALREKK